MISKIVSVFPMNSRMGILSYLESAGNQIAARSADAVVEILYSRYEKQIRNERGHGLLHSLILNANQTRILRISGRGLADALLDWMLKACRSIQAFRIPGGKLPILLATMGTFENPTSFGDLRILSIKCMRLIE